MRNSIVLAIGLALCLLLAACAKPTPTPTPTPLSDPTATPAPTETPAPTDTPARPTMTPFPTPEGVAPERTFAPVGSVAIFEGTHDVSGKAVVAGLQTLIIQRFKYDGKAPQADIRLVKDRDYEHPAAILLKLERAYTGELVLLPIPLKAGPGTVDSIVVYAPDTQEVLAEAEFVE